MQTSQTSKATRRRSGQHIGAEETPAAQAAFLEAFRAIGIIRAAADKAGISRRLVYDWRESDPAFASAFELAEHDANDVIRREIHRRGVSGWIETTTTVEQTGEGDDQIVTVKTVKTRRYSDSILRLLAMARMAEYRDRLDVTTKGEQLGAYQAIASVADDPDKATAASDLLKLFAGDSLDAGRPGVDSEPG